MPCTCRALLLQYFHTQVLVFHVLKKMALKGVPLLVLCFLIVCAAKAEFFSSTDKIIQLVEKEKDLLGGFSLYIDAEEENLTKMRRVLLIYQLLSFIYSGDPEKTMSNPVEAYKLLRRLRNEWKAIVTYTKFSLYEKFQELMEEEFLRIPHQNDLDGAAAGLIRLQEIYKLYPHNITKETALSTEEAFHVGLVAYNQDKFQHAFLWFVYGYNMLIDTEVSTVTKEQLLDYLGSSAYFFGSIPVAIYFTQQLLNLDPTNEEARFQLIYYRSLRLKTTLYPDIFTLNNKSKNSYEALCRGEIHKRTTKKQRALSCRYSTGGGNPRLMYAPVKEEEEWDQPRIIRYHDIITDREIEILKNITRPWLSRSKIVGDGHGEVSDIRVSQSAVVGDQYLVVARVNQRIADITGLSMESSERLVVQNYGIGGRYTPHHDESDDENEWADQKQKRIATFLIYMSDVEMGGATVFPQVGVSLKALKGSAVFWYNLLQNGSTDSRTLHAGCPVLVGNKWVANKWIHDFGQEFRRPCSLSERE